MEIHSLNSKTPSATDVLALDTGSDTYKATGTALVENAAPTYTSGDAASPTSWTDVTVLSSGLSVKTLLNRISTMIKNVRWLYSKLGTTELGTTATTVTGAIAEHESDISQLNSKLNPTAWANAGNLYYKKQANIVAITYSASYGSAVNADTWFTIATLPEGFRPGHVVAFAATFGNQINIPGAVRINTDGTVQVCLHSALTQTNSYMAFGGAFIINGNF